MMIIRNSLKKRLMQYEDKASSTVSEKPFERLHAFSIVYHKKRLLQGEIRLHPQNHNRSFFTAAGIITEGMIAYHNGRA